MRMRAYGLALPELLVALGLNLLVTLLAVRLVQAATTAYEHYQSQSLLIQDAHAALELLGLAAHQAGHGDYVWASGSSGLPLPVMGLDNATLSGGGANTVAGIGTVIGPGIHGSDVLAVHFSSIGPDTQGNVLNCAGRRVPVAQPALPDQGWSIFYLAPGVNGESEMKCKYLGLNEWVSESLVSGVENLQFLYGVDRSGDGWPDQFMSANAIEGENIFSGGSQQNVWRQVVAIHISILMRSSKNNSKNEQPESLDFFGIEYTSHHAGKDKGTHLTVTDFPVNQRKRLRKIFERVIFLQNRAPLVSEGSKKTAGLYEKGKDAP